MLTGSGTGPVHGVLLPSMLLAPGAPGGCWCTAKPVGQERGGRDKYGWQRGEERQRGLCFHPLPALPLRGSRAGLAVRKERAQAGSCGAPSSLCCPHTPWDWELQIGRWLVSRARLRAEPRASWPRNAQQPRAGQGEALGGDFPSGQLRGDLPSAPRRAWSRQGGVSPRTGCRVPGQRGKAEMSRRAPQGAGWLARLSSPCHLLETAGKGASLCSEPPEQLSPTL